MNTARALLDEMLNAYSNEGVHIPCTTFDGQFSRLKDFDNQIKCLHCLHCRENTGRLFTNSAKLNSNMKLQTVTSIRTGTK